MGILATLAYYRTAVFYYILGGVTFLPLCALGLFTYFWLCAPLASAGGRRNGVASSVNGQSLAEVLGTEGEFSEERKRKALELAAWNRDAQSEEEARKAKESEGDGATVAAVPAAARRMKPPPPQPRRPHRAGWLTVRRHFLSEGVNLAIHQAATAHQQAISRQSNASPSTNGSASSQAGSATDGKGHGYVSSFYRGMLNYRNKNAPPSDQKRSVNAATTPDSGRSTPEHAQEDAVHAPSQPNASASTPAGAIQSATKETFYCILKGPILYLYSNADPSSPDTEVHAAIDLRNKRVSIFVAGVGDTMGEPDESMSSSAEGTLYTSTDSPAMSDAETTNGKEPRRSRTKASKARVRDGELFVKRNAIRVVSMGSTTTRLKDSGMRFAQWFIFAKNATQLEDWYHAILSASRLPEGTSGEGPDLVGPVFSSDDMANLLVSLDSVPDPIPLRWLNAMLGRIFFSIYKTAWLEDYIKAKFRKKMSRVRTPGFLSDIRIRDVDLGSTPPAFSRPMLKSLTGDGEASMEVELHYTGALRLTISTVLTISLGSRFKQYNVSLVLAVIVNSLEGNLLLHIKPPPSNRVWFGFTKLPKIDISVEPVVSERKVQWSMVKRLIEGRIRELLTESLVLPNMDDIPFFDTRDLDHRGGIWADAGKHAKKVDLESTTSAQQDPTGPPTAEPDTVGPQSKSTPASVLNVSVGQDDEDPATDVLDSNHLRNRRPLGGKDVEVTSSSEPALLAPSAAVAGLSSLLARDQQAASSSSSSVAASSSKTTSVSGPSSQRRRTSWFAGGKTNGTKTPSSVKSTSGVRRSGQAQSSLAWGNASLERPSSASTGGELLSAAAAMAAHERNKESINSLSSVGTSSNTDEADEAEVDGAEDAISAGADADGEDTIDSAAVDSARLAEDGGAPKNKSASDAESLATRDDTAVDSQSATHDAVLPPFESTLAPPPSVPARPIAKTSSPSMSQAAPPLPQRSTPRSPSSSYATSTHSTSGAVESPQQPRGSLAVQSLATLQRERYGPPANSDETAARAALTSAALLSTWNKAKASVADRDSRQAAAKEAKDAIKRGWSSWKASRGAVSQQSGGASLRDDAQSGRGTDAVTTTTSSDRLGEATSMAGADVIGNWRAQQQQREARSRTNSWLASSPEDPASLGVGFDVLSSSPSSLSLAAGGASTEHAISTSGDNVKDEHGTRASSRANSISGGRKPYHEHRADRLTRKAVDNTSRPSSRASSVHRSLSRPSTPPPLPAETSPAVGAVEGAWDASAPGLSTPLPAAQREDSRTPTHQQPSLSTSPSTIRRTLNASGSKLSPSTSQTALGGGGVEGVARPSYSFLPGQPTATISLSDVVSPTFPTPTNVTAESTTKTTQEEAALTAPSDAKKPPVAVERRTSAAASETANPTVRTPSPPKGIKQQPVRAAMMAVPGIPSMQKAGPQSFEAPAPTPPPPSSTRTIGETLSTASSPRLGIGNLISRIPSFSAVSGAQTASTPAALPLPDTLTDSSSPALATSTDTETPSLSTTKSAEDTTASTPKVHTPILTPEERPDTGSAPQAEQSQEPADLAGGLGLTLSDGDNVQHELGAANSSTATKESTNTAETEEDFPPNPAAEQISSASAGSAPVSNAEGSGADRDGE